VLVRMLSGDFISVERKNTVFDSKQQEDSLVEGAENLYINILCAAWRK